MKIVVFEIESWERETFQHSDRNVLITPHSAFNTREAVQRI